MKWWSKSPPRIRVTGRHGKPRVVQDRTGEGLPARYSPGISRTLRKQGASLRRSERNGRPASQGADRIRLTGERHSPISANLARQGRADPPRSAEFGLEAEVRIECDFFGDFLSRAWAIHASGDKWAGRDRPALPGGKRPSEGYHFQFSNCNFLKLTLMRHLPHLKPPATPISKRPNLADSRNSLLRFPQTVIISQ